MGRADRWESRQRRVQACLPGRCERRFPKAQSRHLAHRSPLTSERTTERWSISCNALPLSNVAAAPPIRTTGDCAIWAFLSADGVGDTVRHCCHAGDASGQWRRQRRAQLLVAHIDDANALLLCADQNFKCVRRRVQGGGRPASTSPTRTPPFRWIWSCRNCNCS